MGTSGWVSTSLPYLMPRGTGQGDAWAAEAAAQGRRGTQRIVHAGEVPAPADVAALLGVPEGEPVVVRRRLILLDDEPSELTDTYYPAAIAGAPVSPRPPRSPAEHSPCSPNSATSASSSGRT